MTKSDTSYKSVPTSADSHSIVEAFEIETSDDEKDHVVTPGAVNVSDNTEDKSISGHISTTKVDPYEPEMTDLDMECCRLPVNLTTCPKCCQSHVRTRTRTYPTAATWTGVAVSAVLFFPICWIPLVVDTMKQTDHFCQNCNQKLATIKPLDGCCVKERR